MSYYTKKYLKSEKEYIRNDYYYKKYFKNEWKILDVGCSVGNFIVNNPNNIVGIDKDRDALKVAKFERGLYVVQHNIEEEAFNRFEDKFDAINLGGMLEHCYDPDKVIMNCLSDLKKGGTIVISVPALPYISLKKFYRDYTHRMVYTMESMVAIAQNHNLEIVAIEVEPKYSIKGMNKLNKKFPKIVKFLMNYVFWKGEALIGVYKKGK